ncbi:MAG: 16S rRNA (guanine(527)-N(7))-methyltransferase RsmG [Bdellovibrionales bacterium]
MQLEVKEVMLSRKSEFMALGVGEDQFALMLRYVDELVQKNTEINLFSRKMTAKELVENQIFDSLMALPGFIELPFTKLADFGSGGGLPAALLAIMFPDREVLCFEKTEKKNLFLKQLSQWIPNLKVLGAIEPKKLIGVDLITAKAFKPIETIINFSKDYYYSGGTYLIYKARMDTIESEIEEAKRFKPQVSIAKLESPFLEVERNLVFFRKEES